MSEEYRIPARIIALAMSVSALLHAEGTASVAGWTRDLSDERVEVRLAAAEALSHLRGGLDDALPTLVKALRDPAPDVRTDAGLALLSCGEKGRAPLLEALKDPDPGVRTSVLAALQSCPDLSPKMAPLLIEIFRAEHGEARAYAAYCLAHVAKAAVDAIPDLTEGVLAEDQVVAENCLFAIAAIGPVAHAALPTVVRVMSRSPEALGGLAARALSRLGPDGTEALLAALRSEDTRVRAAASIGLESADPSVIARLLEALASERGDARARIAHALTRMDDLPADAAPALVRALADEGDARLRAELEGALARLGPHASAAVPRLIEVVHDPAAADRVAALSALETIAPRDPRVVDAALEAYGESTPRLSRRRSPTGWFRRRLRSSASRNFCTGWHATHGRRWTSSASC